MAASAFRTTLARELEQPVDIYDAPLDMARFPDPGSEKPLVDFLEQRFVGSPVDLVVPIGSPAVRFAAQHRKRLFAETPIVFVGAEPRTVPPDALETNATLVTAKADLPGIVEDILQLQPETTNIVVVVGISPVGKFWAGEFRREWQAFTNRVGFSWLDTLSLQQMQERAQSLPPRSFIFFAMLLMDADRVPYDGYEALEAIHAVANAPMFAYYRSQLGRGAIGGRLYEDSRVGTQAAKVAIRILRGERAADIPPEIIGCSPPTYDWRELTRWGISSDRLPAGSVIEFREPTFWEQYRWRIVGVAVFCCLQTALIIGLIVNRAKRREEQAAATLIADLSSRFVNLPADKVDVEIEAAQRRICEGLGFDITSLWQWSADHPDDLVLTHVCRLVDGPPITERMSAREYFPWCLQEVKAKRRFAIGSLEEAPAGAARDVEVFRHFGIEAGLTIPLMAGEGPTLGAVSFNAVRARPAWPEEVVERLQVVAQIFANALARKRADQELRESEARLSLAAEAAAAGLWRLDLATQCFWVTKKTRELFAFGADEVVSFERFVNAVYPEDRETVRQTVQKVLASKGDVQVEYRILRPDGSVRWMQSQGRVEGSPSGAFAGLMGVTVDVTPRKEAEEARRQSEARLASAVEVAGLGFYDIGSAPGQVFVDERLRSLLGLTPQDNHRAQAFWIEHIHPEDRERVQELSQKVWGGELEGVAVEYRYQHAQRGTLWLSHVSRALEQGRGGHAVRWLGVIRDITKRKEMELALAESERRYRTLFESAPEGIVLIGMDGRVRAANAVQAHLYGYESADQLLGRYAPLFVAEKDRERSARIMRDQLQGLDMPARRYTVVRRDGSEFIGEVTSAPLRGPGQEVQAYLCLTRDVTALVKAEEDVRASERKFRTLHESMMDAFVSADLEGRIQECNAVYEHMLGYSERELRQLTHQNLTPERWRAREADILRDQVLRRGYSDIYEKEYRRKDGTVFPAELRTVLTRDEAGQPVGVWAIVRDIAERKRAEEALRDFSERFIRAQEEERSRLARELHDDITQRLARLAIDVGQCERRKPTAPPVESLQEVREGLVQLSEDVHALSYRLHPSILEDLGLAEALRAEAERFERQGANPIEIKMEDIPESVSTDAALCLFRVAQEALRNAARHASAQQIALSLRGLDGGLQLAVQDDGRGFDATLKRDRPSLGLAGMRERVRLIGGELDIESAPGHGTTVLAWVPIAKR